MNYSTLEPKLSYSVPLKSYGNTCQEWDGQRSRRFGRTIRHGPHKDLIATNFDLPNQTVVTGRVHYNQPTSFQKPFRSSVHKTPPIKHWHLRQSKIRTMEFKPTQPLPRAERVHNNLIRHNPEQCRIESLRTFQKSYQRTQRQYSIEDRMQKKGRIDQAELRRTFYKDLDIFKRA